MLEEFLEADDISDGESVDDGGVVEDVPMECSERNELLRRGHDKNEFGAARI